MGRRCEGLCVRIKCLFCGGDAACFRVATAWRRNIIYGKTLHSLRWQPETNGCVSATDSVKMRLRILTSCKNRVKTLYKQEEGRKRLKDKESKRQRDKERKRRREGGRKRRRAEGEGRKPFLCATEGRDLCHLTAQPCCGKIECAEGKAISSLVKTLLA